MRKKLGIIFLLAIIVWNVPSAFMAAELVDTADVDEFVMDYLERNGLPGASIVIVKEGRVLYETGYGHDSEGKPLTETSPLRIGSVSKSFTAFAVLQLVDEGKLNLDDPVVKHLPDVQLNDPGWKDVTIRQLLSHTSGIPSPTIVAPANDLEAGVERLYDFKLQSQPGEKYAYSNPNYWLLAYLVEKVSGIEFSDYLKQKVFSPLAMEDSLTAVNSGDPVQGLSKGHVTAYGTAIPWTELEKMFMGAGGVVSTAEDMGKWLSMHTNEGKTGTGEPLLSEELLEESYSPQPGSEKYGLGWSLSSENVKPARISHSGALSTFQTQQDIVPGSGYAVAVLLNSFTPTFEHAYEISSGIIQLTEGHEPEVKSPIPAIIDLSLGGITLIYLLLGGRGILRSKKWAERRKHQPAWRYFLRVLPQLAAAAAVGWFFFIVPTLQDNSSTIMDAFGIWPAAAILLAVIFLIGLVITIMRVYDRMRMNGIR
jgi:CubicO group peptidase (beta-lactamase class C family)